MCDKIEGLLYSLLFHLHLGEFMSPFGGVYARLCAQIYLEQESEDVIRLASSKTNHKQHTSNTFTKACA